MNQRIASRQHPRMPQTVLPGCGPAVKGSMIVLTLGCEPGQWKSAAASARSQAARKASRHHTDTGGASKVLYKECTCTVAQPAQAPGTLPRQP